MKTIKTAKKQKLKESKGITLIALVITIIVSAAGTYLRGGGAAWSFLRQQAAARIYPDNYSDPKRLYSFAPLVALRHTPIIP